MPAIEKKIENVVDAILEDYRAGRDIDRMEQFQQPDKDVIVEIIEKLRRIVFPGYFTEKNYRIYNAKHNLSMLIEDVMFYCVDLMMNFGLHIPDTQRYFVRTSKLFRSLRFWRPHRKQVFTH